MARAGRSRSATTPSTPSMLPRPQAVPHARVPAPGCSGRTPIPDILTGQQLIHPAGARSAPGRRAWTSTPAAPGPTRGSRPSGAGPTPTAGWGSRCRSTGSPSPRGRARRRRRPPRSPAARAFVAGYLTHAAGDMFGHTFINYYTGGAFTSRRRRRTRSSTSSWRGTSPRKTLRPGLRTRASPGWRTSSTSTWSAALRPRPWRPGCSRAATAALGPVPSSRTSATVAPEGHRRLLRQEGRL